MFPKMTPKPSMYMRGSGLVLWTPEPNNQQKLAIIEAASSVSNAYVRFDGREVDCVQWVEIGKEDESDEAYHQLCRLVGLEID